MIKKISVIIIICFFFVFFIFIKTNQNHCFIKEMEFSVESEVDNYERQNCEEPNDLIPTAESDTEKIMNMAENKDIDILVKQLEILIQRNEFESFLFQSEEKAICIYEGTIEFDTMNDKFALYKETVEKDIVFVNMIFIEKETGNIYTWREEELIQIGALERVKLELTNSSESEIDNNSLYENITEDELLDKVMEALEQIGCNKLNLIYDGRIEFVNRNYYTISSFDDFEDRILRDQGYYIDCKNGYIYRVGENTDFLRTELYYITNLQ